MPLSFNLKPAQPQEKSPARRRVLITGASGTIGSWLAENLHADYDLRLMVHRPPKDATLAGYGEVVQSDLSSAAGLDELKKICTGIDTIVHLAGDPSPSAVWEDLLEGNILGTYHLMVAAKAAGCRRVIFASSIHAVGGYPPGVQVKTSDPVNPGDLYGVSKCFGEALGRYMATFEGLEVIALRIGAFTPREKIAESLDMLDGYVSPRDFTQLVRKCIDDTKLQFAIFHGVSGNAFQRLDISDARELIDFAPEDDFFRENPELAAFKIQEQRRDHNLDDGQSSGLREELADDQRP